MAEQQPRATLKDVINYEPAQYLSQDEMDWIQSVFKDPRAIKIVRKLLIPTINDPELPIEQLGNDAWFAGRQWEQIPAEEAKVLMCARQDALQFIMGGLIKLTVIANQKSADPVEEAFKRSKDSVK